MRTELHGRVFRERSPRRGRRHGDGAGLAAPHIGRRRRFLDMARLAVVGPLERDPAVIVIADPHPQAFCVGYLRPEIYVPERTVELLSDDELAAVLAHEHQHRRVRDPLRFACGRILSDALFFVPALRLLCRRYADLAEVGADAAAIGDVGRRPLARALLAIEQSGHPAVAGFSAERVDSLLGQPVRLSVPLRRVGASLAGLAGLGGSIWLISGVASAQATLNPPILSPRPCIAVTMALVLLAGALRLTR
ncbi:MAG TPA: M56 family metallopeptidase [Solirubrobacteraceae bacterium]|nr:M56 family metallopeptidase [Solirubrobacteraceae bacterium]